MLGVFNCVRTDGLKFNHDRQDATFKRQPSKVFPAYHRDHLLCRVSFQHDQKCLLRAILLRIVLGLF